MKYLAFTSLSLALIFSCAAAQPAAQWKFERLSPFKKLSADLYQGTLDGKTAVCDASALPFIERCLRRQREYERALADYREDKRIWDSRNSRDGNAGDIREPVRPSPPKFIVYVRQQPDGKMRLVGRQETQRLGNEYDYSW